MPVYSTLHNEPNPHITLLFPFALQHATLFESIITVCRASELICLGRSASDDMVFLHHRAQTISTLRSKLRSNDFAGDMCLLAVSMLLTSEVMYRMYALHILLTETVSCGQYSCRVGTRKWLEANDRIARRIAGRLIMESIHQTWYGCVSFQFSG